MTTQTILLERVYDDLHQKGYRVLVDRLWPRGITKAQADIDEWCKELTPSPDLRKWFGHKPERWEEFRRLYKHELKQSRTAACALLQRAKGSKLILIYGAKDKAHTHALVLQEYLNDILKTVDDDIIEVSSPVCYADKIE